jgi:hypothetical protein
MILRGIEVLIKLGLPSSINPECYQHRNLVGDRLLIHISLLKLHLVPYLRIDGHRAVFMQTL